MHRRDAIVAAAAAVLTGCSRGNGGVPHSKIADHDNLALIADLKRMVDAEPSSAARNRLVSILVARGQYREASAHEDAIRYATGGIERRDGALRIHRARSLAALHRFDEAEADLLTVKKLLGTDRAEVDLLLADIAIARKDPGEALRLLEAAARSRPDVSTLGALAAFQFERGETVAANVLFDRAESLARADQPSQAAWLHVQRGLCHLRASELDAARARFARAYDLDPQLPAAREWRNATASASR